MVDCAVKKILTISLFVGSPDLAVISDRVVSSKVTIPDVIGRREDLRS